MAADVPEQPDKRIVYLNRRVAFIEPDRINVRPALAAVIFPGIGLVVGIAAFVSVVMWLDWMPFAVALLLLALAIVSIPLAGIGFVYAIGGTNVVFDRAKQSGLWQQGFLGMGVGTTELVPFWKIQEIRIDELTRERQRGELQEVAQLAIVLVKVSGKRLTVGDLVVPRSMVRQGLEEVRAVAQAIAEMTDKPLIAPEVVRRRRASAPAESEPEHEAQGDAGETGPA